MAISFWPSAFAAGCFDPSFVTPDFDFTLYLCFLTPTWRPERFVAQSCGFVTFGYLQLLKAQVMCTGQVGAVQFGTA